MEYTKDLFEKLRPDASVATSGRNFCCIVGGFSIKSIEKTTVNLP